MFGSYSVTAHFADGTSDAVAYGTPSYCLREAERRNAELAASQPQQNPGATTRR